MFTLSSHFEWFTIISFIALRICGMILMHTVFCHMPTGHINLVQWCLQRFLRLSHEWQKVDVRKFLCLYNCNNCDASLSPLQSTRWNEWSHFCVYSQIILSDTRYQYVYLLYVIVVFSCIYFNLSVLTERGELIPHHLHPRG